MTDLTPAAFLAGLCGLGVLLVLALSIWSKRERQGAAVESYQADADARSLPGPLKSETGRLLSDGRKIEAIKRVREATGWGLKRAKEAVEQLGAPSEHRPKGSDSRSGNRSPAGPSLEEEIRRLLAGRRRIEAVKLVRDRTGWGLSESKEYVERIGGSHLDD